MADYSALVQLRLRLRQATADSHAGLDSMVCPAGLVERLAYVDFLQGQYRARRPIETWAEAHCPDEFAPPPVTDLIVADLREMGGSVPVNLPAFALPAHAHPLGLAWAIAGSHLGNRMMLKHIHDAESGLPTQFLRDDTMKVFWRRLAPLLDELVTAEKARAPTVAAEVVFAHFQANFSPDMRRRAA